MNSAKPIFKKLLVLVLLFVFTGMAFAIEITLTPPQFAGEGIYEGPANELNGVMDEVFGEFKKKLVNEVGNIDLNPQKLIGAFGNSSVFSSDGASQRGYRGYNLFAITVGPMIGFQLPSSPFEIINEIDNMFDTLEQEQDIKLGLDIQLLNFQVGINTSKFLMENLYLGVKFGYMNIDLMEGLNFNTFSFGVMGNYQWMPRRSIIAGLFLWRGINFGAGLIYQKTGLNYEMELDEQTDTTEITTMPGSPITTTLTPKVNLGIGMNTLTIPLEVVTSVRILYFLNLSFGLGVDLGFGSSELKVGAEAKVNIGNLPKELTQIQPAAMSATMGGDSGPDFFNPKIMTGLGFSLGPAIIDIPVTFYLGSGYSAGVTVGIAW
jgi:hypothetical protein